MHYVDFSVSFLEMPLGNFSMYFVQDSGVSMRMIEFFITLFNFECPLSIDECLNDLDVLWKWIWLVADLHKFRLCFFFTYIKFYVYSDVPLSPVSISDVTAPVPMHSGNLISLLLTCMFVFILKLFETCMVCRTSFLRIRSVNWISSDFNQNLIENTKFLGFWFCDWTSQLWKVQGQSINTIRWRETSSSISRWPEIILNSKPIP